MQYSLPHGKFCKGGNALIFDNYRRLIYTGPHQSFFDNRPTPHAIIKVTLTNILL
jgi:hypothetical protein